MIDKVRPMNLKKKLAALKKPAHKAAPPTRKPFLMPPRTKSAPSDDSAYKLMLDDLRKSGLDADDAKRLQLRPYSAKESEALDLPRGADAGYKIPYFDSRDKLLSMFRYRYFKTVSDGGFTAVGQSFGDTISRTTLPSKSTCHAATLTGIKSNC